MHAMQQIASTGSTPVTRTPVSTIGLDAKMIGNNLANEVIATVYMQASPWHGFAVRLIAMPNDARAQFLAATEAWLKDMRKRNSESIAAVDRTGKPDPTKSDTKRAGALVNSATVQVSKLRTIASAFAGAATVEGLIEHAKLHGRVKGTITLDDIGFEVMVEDSRLFSKSKAGRPTDAWVVKLSKWLDKNPPAEGEDDTMYNEISKQVAAAVAKMQAVI